MPKDIRILTVDDEVDFCNVIQGYLTRIDSYELFVCHSGNDAFQLLGAELPFDVVLLDLKLPDMNGFKIMQHILKQNAGTLVIIMTGYASLESATEALRQGAYDYLTKPFSGEELIKTVQNAVSHKKTVMARERAEKALKDSEERFRHLVENFLSGILIIQNRKVVYQNTVQKEFFNPMTDIIRSKDYSSIHPDDVDKIKDMSRRFLSKDSPLVETDFRFFAPVSKGSNAPAELRWVLSRASYVNYREETAILINSMDITRLKELEQLIIVKNKMHSLGRVAAGVAHEIRNPLTGINSYIYSLESLIESGIDSPEGPSLAKDMIKQIQTASNKIESVIKRVMDFAKPGIAQMALVNINDALQEAITLSQITARKKGIFVETDLFPDLPKCYADPQLMEQVVLNLINNAIQALEKMDTEKKVCIASTQRNGKICIQVSDSGPGIPEEMHEKIFDPFFTTKEDGAGIGLNIAQRIVADHHGNIKAGVSDSGGALFMIDLPIDRRKMSR
jgi:PAS domain S-box-containing protein